jgi:hypothetical protein
MWLNHLESMPESSDFGRAEGAGSFLARKNETTGARMDVGRSPSAHGR